MNDDLKEKIDKRSKDLNRIRGCMIGGAAGDALGYAVEFSSENQIFTDYGRNGIRKYNIDKKTGKALISDDTQMSLFTASGLLVGDTRGQMRGIMGLPREYVRKAYHDWYKTQVMDFSEVNGHERFSEKGRSTWLLDVPELFSRRAPGNTCLSALADSKIISEDCITDPVNSSKGCGGIMRTAPTALIYRPGVTYGDQIEKLDMEAAQIAGLTHGHSLGYMPSAVLNHIISRILTDSDKMTLKEIVNESRDCIVRMFSNDPNIETLSEIITTAVKLSENNASDLENIHILGEGWVAEETLAIAIYCTLKYQDNFSAGIIAAVNHKGDSDSTGAVTGNILGTLLGYDAIDDKWKKDLELTDIIMEIAEDLCYGCLMSEYGNYRDPAWISKYIKMKRYSDFAE